MPITSLLSTFAEEIIQDPVFFLDSQGRLLFANDKARNVIKESRYKTKAYLDKLQEELALHSVFLDQDPAPLQQRKVAIAGSTFTVSAILREKIIALVLRDISDMRSMAATYSRYAEMFSNLSRALDHMHQGILVTDPWDVVLYGNKSAGIYLEVEKHADLAGARVNSLSPLFAEFSDNGEETRIIPHGELLGAKSSAKINQMTFLRIRSIPLFYLEKKRGKLFLIEPFTEAAASQSALPDFPQPLAKKRQTEPAPPEKGNEPLYSLGDFVGQSKSVLKLKAIVRKVARTSSTVLIQSESGTGKELLAHALHSLSNRSRAPFVKLNCASIPETLLESEIFGYDSGAFTGAKKGGHAGRFEQADGGTIFLDEIGEMPIALQAKLLRVIQEREVQRLGGRTTKQVDVRIICATNINLLSQIEQQMFRSDLYYRLNVVTLEIPPLRERKEDIKSLVLYFLRKNSQLFQKHVKGISQGVFATFMNYNWPGNVRELGNAIEYAFNVVDGDIIETEHLPGYLLLPDGQPMRENSKLSTLLDEYSVKIARSVLDRHNGNKVETARELGVSRATLYRILSSARP